MRIGVDGVTASGKTTFADRLAALLGGVARLTIDEFHRPGQASYYPDSFDFAAFRAAVLAATTPLVADGVFLFHPALRDLWDLKIFLDCDRGVALARGLARDRTWMEDAEQRYATRYVPGETQYLEEVDPRSLADLVVDTT
jgi:uridine kinase